MANRMKEDEKNEKIIRSLLKLPENRRCINCNSLGPQYVCTNFWTFVCTTCSGIHREFTHRVKSVSMAKFTSQEVAALQGGGNARAKESLFKELDPQRHSFPDSSNIEKLRDFIKHAYVDRRYGGERGFEKPPKGEESYENRKQESYHSGSRSPPYEDTYDRRYSDRPSPGGRSDDSNSRYDERRSPGYDRENQQYGEYRSSARHEVVNDWRRDDRFGNGRRPEDRRTSDGDSRPEDRSPDHQNDKDMISPPIVRPVRDILGDNVVPLRIIEPPKANGTRAADGFPNTRRTASSSSLGSADGNPVEPKRETLASLIDFDTDPDPPTKSPVQQTQQTFMGQPAAQPTSSGDTNWASFDVATEAAVSHFPSNASNIQSVLSQLSNPTSAPGQLSGISNASGTTITAPLGNVSIPPSGHFIAGSVSHPSVSVFNGGIPAPFPVSNPSLIPPTGQWPSMQYQHHSLFPAAGIHSSAQPFNSPAITSTTQTWSSSFAPNAPAASRLQEIQAPPKEVKSSGRTALPEDLFAPTYPSFSVPSHGWQSGAPRGMGYTMQYNTAAPIPTYSQSSKLANPFDLHNDPPPLQAPTFPSMASLHGSLPNMPPPPGLMHASSLGTPFPAWSQPHSSPYASGLHSQAPSVTSALPPGAYMGQQVPNNMTPSWNQGVGGFGNEGSAFSPMNSNQLMSGGYPAPTPASFTSTGGNPFG